MAGKILEIGKAILKSSARTSDDATAGVVEAKRALNSVIWIQKAFALVDKMEDEESSGIAELKVSLCITNSRPGLRYSIVGSGTRYVY